MIHQPKVILVIMDGWGFSLVEKGNAVRNADTPNFDQLWNNYKHLLLNAFGGSVGLPWGAIGSSEVGHTSIGSGKLIHQELSYIDDQIKNGDFFQNKILLELIEKTSKTGKNIHLVGLVSNGGVHSHLDHLYALLKLIKLHNFKQKVYIHAITDGRDTSPKSAIGYIKELEQNIKSIGINARIASVSGRYFGMDRDNRWDRTKKAYLSMTSDTGTYASSAVKAIEQNYAKDTTDEFIQPIQINSGATKFSISNLFNKKAESSLGIVQPGDGVIFFNIRPDRMRQITEMFLLPRNDVGTKPVADVTAITLTTYNEYLPAKVVFPAEKSEFPLARVLSDNGIKQGHFAETEKYAHVTYFFNGGNPEPYKNELWNLIPSPDVATYDLKPEMSAKGVTDKVIEVVDHEKLDFVLINYANADMVGHTGLYEKVITAVETIDVEIGRLLKTFSESTIIFTADHGNAECMIHPETGEVDKKHTVNPVPFIIKNPKFESKSEISDENLQVAGILADIAPTVLYFFGLPKNEQMSGINLIEYMN